MKMIETPKAENSTVPVACTWWCALAGATLALSGLAPGGILRDRGLPAWAGVTLACTELAMLALLVLAAVAVSGTLARFRRPGSPALRFTGRALRVAAAGATLFAFAGSWGSFWYTGRFLDREAVAFLFGDLRTVFGYAAGMNAALFLGIAAATVGAAVLASEFLPRWLLQCRPIFLRRFTRGTIATARSRASEAISFAERHWPTAATSDRVRRLESWPISSSAPTARPARPLASCAGRSRPRRRISGRCIGGTLWSFSSIRSAPISSVH